MTTFAGFPRELFTFLEGLSEDNSKAYWNANKASWQAHVRGPMLALLSDLADEFGPLRMFRPNRDLRFTKDSPPTSCGSVPPASPAPSAASATT